MGSASWKAVAYFAGEEHSDHPQCSCPVLTSFGIKLNDRYTDEERQLPSLRLPRVPTSLGMSGFRGGDSTAMIDVLDYICARCWCTYKRFAPGGERHPQATALCCFECAANGGAR